jgi:hypothetical protein
MLKWNDEDPDLHTKKFFRGTNGSFLIVHFINNLHADANSKLAILNIYIMAPSSKLLSIRLLSLGLQYFLAGPLRHARKGQWLSS